MAIPNGIDPTRPYVRYDRPAPPTLGTTAREGAGASYASVYAWPWEVASIYVFTDALGAGGLAVALTSVDGRVLGPAVVTVALDGEQTGYLTESGFVSAVLRAGYGSAVSSVSRLSNLLAPPFVWSMTTSS